MNSDKIGQIKRNTKFVLHLIYEIQKEINRKITNEEEKLVVFTLSNTPDSYFKEYSITQIISILKNNIVDEILTDQKSQNVDTHEMLKDIIDPEIKFRNIEKKKEHSKNILDINIESIFGYNEISTLVKKVNEPISNVRNAYILLDTRHRLLENDGTLYFSWGHINQLAMSQGTINSIGNIKDIISITIMPYAIPNIPLAAKYNLISISVEEFIQQSIVAHENRRYHFMGHICNYNANDKWIFVKCDDNHDGEYKFNKSVTKLDTITLKFGNPLEPIVFDKDRLSGTITYGSPTIITFTESHKLNTNDYVYLDTFKTINTHYDSNVVSQMNNKYGHLSMVLNPLTISIPVNTNNIISLLSGTIAMPSISLGGNIMIENNKSTITGIGTSFMTDFLIGDYINFNNKTYHIKSIENNTQLTLYSVLFGTGIYSYRKTGTNIIGTNTMFDIELNPGDNIIINDGGYNPSYIIKSIESATSLNISNPYEGLNGNIFTFSKDNSIPKNWDVFFGSKRIFIEMEIKYLS